MNPRLFLTWFLFFSGVAWLRLVEATPRPSGQTVDANDVHKELTDRMERVRVLYDSARRGLVHQVNQRLGIDYEALSLRYQEADFRYRQKLNIVEKIPNLEARHREEEKLRAELVAPDYRRFAEARLVLENELERNYALKADLLQGYEGILDLLIDVDPTLSYFFRSEEYQQRFGLLLKRMVWDLSGGEAASTKALNTSPVFADRRRMPFLIQVSPTAFTSLSYLRSILIHELNHVLLEKEPLFLEVRRRSGPGENMPKKPITDLYSFFFNLRFARTPDYQYHLIQEYYSFEAQLACDDSASLDPRYRLPPSDRRRIKELADWALSELSTRNQAFVKKHPNPPILAYLQREL